MPSDTLSNENWSRSKVDWQDNTSGYHKQGSITYSNLQRDEVFSKYYSLVNMSYSELLRWSENPVSRLASLSRAPIRRNLRLLSKRKELWKKRDLKEAKKVISYLSRARKIKSSKILADGYTKNEIALKNWAFDIKK